MALSSDQASGPTAGPTSALLRHRRAVRAAFFAQGFVFISLTTRLPRFSDRWDLDELQLSGLLLSMVLLAGVGSVVAERVASRRDSATVLRTGLLLVALAVPVLAGATHVAAFAGALAAYGLALGMVDAGTNMQGVAVEHLHGRPLLPSFHGAWMVGGVVGAGLALLTSDLALPVTGAVAVVPLTVALLAPLLRGEHQDATSSPAASVAWRPLLLVGLALVLFYTVETAAMTWGPLHLDDTFDAPQRFVALATFPYLVASGLVRLAGDRLVERFGPVRMLRTAAAVTFAGLAVVVLAPGWGWAVLGFTVVGAGTAVIAPLSFSAAGHLAGAAAATAGAGASRAGVDAVIARFNQFNYAGALVGSVLTGLVGSGSLRIGFAVPLVLVLLIVPLAGAFAPPAERDGAAPPPVQR